MHRGRLIATVLRGYALLGAALIVAALLVTRLPATSDRITRIDESVSRWFAEHRTVLVTDVMVWVSHLADTGTVVAAAAGAVVVLAVTRHREHAVFLVVALLLEVSVFLSVTALVDRPRPDVAAEPIPVTDSSFPSGHVGAGVVLYGGLAIVAASVRDRGLHPAGGTVAAAVPGLVALSRLVLGLHYLSDVLAGAILGLGALVLARRAVTAAHAGP